jgi:hypothetical protein
MHVLGVVLVNVLLVLAARGEDGGGPRPRGAPVLVVGEPVMALAAGGEVVVVATERGEVLLLDGRGAVSRRLQLPGPQEAAGHRAPADGLGHGPGRGSGRTGVDGFLVGAGVPVDDDFNDPYDVDSQVEDPTNVLRNDGPSERRTAGGRSTGADSAVVVAAGGRRAWVADAEGLLRASLDANTPPERVGGSSVARWSALAASGDGRWVAGVRGGWLVRSADAGETFDSIAPVAGPVGRLAVTDQGDVLLVDRSGGHRIGAPADGTAAAWPGALDLCVSGRSTVVLSDGAVVVEESGSHAARALANGRRSGSPLQGPSEVGRTGDRPIALPDDVDRLACDGRDGNRAMGGTSLWTSSDAGRSWSRRSELPPVTIEALAVARGAAWVATRQGLWRVPMDRALEAARNEWRGSLPGESGGAAFTWEGDRTPLPAPRRPSSSGAFIDLSLDARRPPWWTAALPRVDLDFTWATGGGRRDVRAFVLLSFAIERDSGRALLHQHLMRQVLRRRNDLEGAALALSAADSAAADPIDAEERAALAHVLEVSHE